MGPGVMLVPLSLLACVVTSCMLLLYRRPVGFGRFFWAVAGLCSLLAGFMVFSLVETEVYLLHLKDMQEGKPHWHFFVRDVFGGENSDCVIHYFLSLVLYLWGGFLFLKVSVGGSPIRLREAYGWVLVATLVSAVVGCVIGYSLGRFVPEYYRNLYRGGWTPEFDPVSIGVWLGMTQGALSGAVVGLGIVAAIAWYEARKASLDAHLEKVQ